MDRFQEIMRLMNNGLNNASTLRFVVPQIVMLGLEKNPHNIDKVTAWMMSEALLSEPHPGLDKVNATCTSMIRDYQLEQVQTKSL